IFGALAEFERDITRERTQAGLQAARARGRKGGRTKSLTGKKTAMAQALYNDKSNTVDEICKTLNTQSLQVRRAETLFILHFQWITALEERSWNLPGISPLKP